jgi:lysophospholipase L1-like esterase
MTYRRPAPRATAALAALAGLALTVPFALGTGAAAAAPRPSVDYDALGDSYASGFGVPPYGPCGRSEASYAVQLDGRMRIDLDDYVACAGATTASLVAGGQLAALDRDTDLVTLQVGGNDIGWSSAVLACLGGTDAQCRGALELTRARIAGELPALLGPLYARVAEAAPDAHVVVVGYPRLFSPEHGAYLGASPAEQAELNAGADLLNAVIARTAAEHGFQFVDVTKRFEGHGANAPAPWILDASFVPGSFHPNAQGYQAYTAALTAAINPSRLGDRR